MPSLARASVTKMVARTSATRATAAQKVFCIAEIVEQIMGWLPHLWGAYLAESWKPTPSNPMSWGAHNFTRLYLDALVKFAKINTTCFSEAVRILWREGTEIKCRSMINLLASVQPGNRQMYAAFIQTAIITDPQRDKVLASNKIIAGLDFSRLQNLSLVLPGTTGPLKLCLPAINAPKLRVLDIRRSGWSLRTGSTEFTDMYETNRSWSTRMITIRMAESIAKTVKRRFKTLEAITFGPELRASPRVLECFARELPNVEIAFHRRTYSSLRYNNTVEDLDSQINPLMRRFPGTRLLL